MPIVNIDISVVPVGTSNTSISDFIAASEKVLKEFPDIRYQLNPMSTTLEGELDQVCMAVKKMHEAPFSQGAQRVSTTVRIDDRRDTDSSMEHKVDIVREKALL